LTWAWLIETATGAMGMTMEELGNTEPWVFMCRLVGFQNMRVENEKESWRRAMFSAYVMECHNPNIKESQKAATFDDFMRRGKRSQIKTITTEQQLDAFLK
jgi:hypothetical protein